MIWVLGGIFTVATLLFIGLWFGAAWLYDMLRARHKRTLHTTAADERIFVHKRSGPVPVARYATLAPRRQVYWPPAQLPHAAPDTPVNRPPLPGPVVAMLGHATVDELVDSIVMRAVSLVDEPV